MTTTLADAMRQAVAHHQSGRLSDAEKIYRAVLDGHPRHPDANHNMGILALLSNQMAIAISYFQKALNASPDNPQFWISLAECYFRAGQFAEAASLLDQALSRGIKHPAIASMRSHISASETTNPDAGLLARLMYLFNAGDWDQLGKAAQDALQNFPTNAAIWHFLGLSHQRSGRLDNALQALAKAHDLLPSDPVILFHLGLAYQKRGEFGEAAERYGRAISLNPGYLEAHINQGSSLQALGSMDEAISCYRQAIAINPDFPASHNNLGRALQEIGDFSEAVASYRRAVSIQPSYAEAYYNLGNALVDIGRLDDAVTAFQNAIDLRPGYAAALNNLGAACKDLGRDEEALASYRHALSLEPDSASILCNIGDALKDLGQEEEAAESYRRAQNCEPGGLEWLLGGIAAKLPSIVNDHAHIRTVRGDFEADLNRLLATEGAVQNIEAMRFNLFYLAYHGENDRPLMEKVSALIRHKASKHIDPDISSRQRSDQEKRIRVGFISSLFHAHTIGKLTQGYIQRLDRDRFHVTVLHAPGGLEDNVRRTINESADLVVNLPNSFKMAQRKIHDLNLDALYYPDIGMVPFVYFLAHTRLAPVQAVSWGHPVTTGLQTVDYFLSFDHAEPDGAESSYTEMLVRFRHPPTYYQPFFMPDQVLPRGELGLPKDGTLYGCPQALFKFHPDFDEVLADILEQDPTGWIIAVEGRKAYFHERLRQRWAKKHPILLERVIFIPRQPQDRFMMLLANMDVLLDPPHFGSGNTFYESIVSGVPSVTWPGQFMRGRIVSGMYRWLEIESPPIAEKLTGYASLAVTLAADKARVLELRQQLLSKKSLMFGDEQAVRELEQFLEQAVIAARQGEKLHHWQSPLRLVSQSN